MKKLSKLLHNQNYKFQINLGFSLHNINKTTKFSFLDSLKEFLSSKVNKGLFQDKNLKLEKKYPDKSIKTIIETPIMDKTAKSTVTKSKFNNINNINV